MADVLNVERRDTRGKHPARRMRRAGLVPAVLYGHNEPNIVLSASVDEVSKVVRHGGRVVELRGAVAEKALIREMQWNVYGTEVLHLDFSRVSEDERIEVTVTVELRGESPGTKEGGVVEHLLHEVKIECLALAIPEKLQLNINALAIGDSLSVADLSPPTGVKVLTDPSAMIVHCVLPVVHEEAELGVEAAAVEPELIGRKAEEPEEE